MAGCSLLVCSLIFTKGKLFAGMYYNTCVYAVECNACYIFLEWGADLRSVWSLVF